MTMADDIKATRKKLSDNQIAVLMRLEGGELDDYDFRGLPDELQRAFHELWSGNSKLGHDHVEIENCGGCRCGGCEGTYYSINDNGLAALGKPSAVDDDISLINWIHPDLLKFVQERCPDNVVGKNSYTYEIFGAVFIVTGNNVNIGSMIGFMIDNGWEQRELSDDG